MLAHAPLLDREGVEVELDVPATVTRPWSPALTDLLVGNLLANAMAHAMAHSMAPAQVGSDCGQAARIWIEADAGELRVRNPSGPPPAAVLGADAAGRVRGVKGSASSGQGLGLGLSIVRCPAERHGLALELHHHDGQTHAILRSTGARHRHRHRHRHRNRTRTLTRATNARANVPDLRRARDSRALHGFFTPGCLP